MKGHGRLDRSLVLTDSAKIDNISFWLIFYVLCFRASPLPPASVPSHRSASFVVGGKARRVRASLAPTPPPLVPAAPPFRLCPPLQNTVPNGFVPHLFCIHLPFGPFRLLRRWRQSPPRATVRASLAPTPPPLVPRCAPFALHYRIQYQI